MDVARKLIWFENGVFNKNDGPSVILNGYLLETYLKLGLWSILWTPQSMEHKYKF